MKKLVVITLALLMSLTAQAGQIKIELSDTNVNTGDTVQVNVLGTGFDAFDALDLSINFDTSLFSVDNLDLFGEIDPATVGGDLAASGGFLVLSEQAFGVALSFLDFVPFAGGDFTLASFSLTAITDGSTSFDLDRILAGLLDPISFTNTPVEATPASTQVQANVTNVPAPAALGLFAIAGLMMLRLRKTNN